LSADGRPGVCRCQARIAPAILEGYACGNPDCWRTAEADASFAAFVERLKAERGEASVPRRPEPALPAS